MTKRLVWFVAGALAGSWATVWALVRLRRSAARPTAERVASAVAGTARTGADGVRRFVEDARTQVRLVEQELLPSEVLDVRSEVLDARVVAQRPPVGRTAPGRLTKA